MHVSYKSPDYCHEIRLEYRIVVGTDISRPSSLQTEKPRAFLRVAPTRTRITETIRSHLSWMMVSCFWTSQRIFIQQTFIFHLVKAQPCTVLLHMNDSHKKQPNTMYIISFLARGQDNTLTRFFCWTSCYNIIKDRSPYGCNSSIT